MPAFLSFLSLPFATAQSNTSGTSPPGGWDDFTNNLGSDLAPLLALFGEQVTKQYLSESLNLADCLLFALAPLGIITAMVSAIRVAGSPLLRSLVGRAKESRGGVEADVMSSTSMDVCELWNGEGVVRVMGRPVLLQLVCIDVRSEPQFSGIYTFNEAVRSGLYKPDKCGATSDLEHLIDHEGQRYLDMPPNLSLNVSVQPLEPWLLGVFIAAGILLQGAVLVYAGISQYYLKLTKGNRLPEPYGFWVFLAGTITLAAGMFGCAMVVERSTTETTWVPVKGREVPAEVEVVSVNGQDLAVGEHALPIDEQNKPVVEEMVAWKSVIWIQQGGQTVGDQRFESFARVTKTSGKILTSHKTAKTVDNTNSSEGDSWDDLPNIEQAPTSLIKNLGNYSLVPAIIITAFAGFVSQFLGLRALHSSVTIAQLGAIIIMTVLRSCAYIQRDKRNDIDEPEQVEGYELDWLAKNLTHCQRWEVIAGPLHDGVELGPASSDTLEVVKTRARLAKLSTEWKLDTRLAVQKLKVVIEATMTVVFANMTLIPSMENIGELEWSIPVKAKFRGSKEAEYGEVTLVVKRSKDDNSNWRSWQIEQSELEAVMCLWISSLTSASRRRKINGDPPLQVARLLELATDDAITDYQLWVNRGSPFSEATFDHNVIYFGWGGTFQGSSSHHPNRSNQTNSLPPGKYLQVDAGKDVETLCAQSLYTRFLSNLASKLIKRVGGTTTPRAEQSSSPMQETPSDSYWAKPCISNSNFASLATIYNDAGLGTIEEAYFSIIPAFRSASRLPFAVDEVTSPTRLKEGKWIEVVEQDLWLYRTIKERASRDSYAMAIAHAIAGRLRTITETLLTGRAYTDGNAGETIYQLWCKAYALCCLINIPSLDQAAAIVNLYMIHRKCKFTTDPVKILENAHSIIHRLPLNDTGKIDIIAKLVCSREYSPFRNELQKYLSNSDSSQLAVMTTIETPIRRGSHGDVPVDLLLIQGYRTPLQFASQIGNIDIVKLLIAAGVDVEAKPAEYLGRTALQAAAEAGHCDIVVLLLPYANVNAEPAPISGRTALQAAAEMGHSEVLELLLEAGAIISKEGAKRNGLTALNAAAKYGHVDILQTLIDANADVNTLPTGDPPRTALQIAAEYNKQEAVRQLLSAGADLNTKPAAHYGRTALQAAAGEGHNETVQLLLASGADLNAKPAARYGRTALQAAAEGGHNETVKLLLACGADINAKPAAYYGRTALQAAAEGGHCETAKLLLARGADITARPAAHGGRTSLQVAAGGGHTETVELLLRSKLAGTQGPTALQAAAEGGHEEVVEMLISHNVDVNAQEESNDRTALQSAAGKGYFGIVSRLLSAGANINANTSTSLGRTALQAAAEGGHKSIVELLLRSGANVDAQPAQDGGRTALQGAAQAGHMGIVELLLSAGAGINAEPASCNGRTALQAAAGAGRLDIVVQLHLSRAYINARPAIIGGRTALQAAAEGGHRDLVEFLLSVKAEINAPPALDNGLTALQAAAGAGHIKIVELLLSKGADINADPAPESGRTALQSAAQGGHSSIVEILLGSGANINAEPALSYGRTVLQAAAEGGHKGIVKLLLKSQADVNAGPGPRYGITAIQAAAQMGHTEIVESLLSAGADINAEAASPDGRTALQAAAGAGHIDIVRLLLSAGADIDYKNSSNGGLTALQAAVGAGMLAVVELLLSAGASIDDRAGGTGGRTTLQLAAEGGHKEVVELLLLARHDLNDDSALADRVRALRIAAAVGHIEVVELLLIEKVSPETEFGPPEETPLYAASSNGHTEIVQLLLEAGAKPCQTALDVARKNNHMEVVKLLNIRSDS